MGGLSYFAFNGLLALLDAGLGELQLSQPSFVYLLIAVLAALNASARIASFEGFALMRSTGPATERISWGLFWLGCLYIIVRFPVTAFAALPIGIGRGLLALVLYSLLFAPLWIGLLVLAVMLTRKVASNSLAADRQQRALYVLTALPLWGLIGEIRMLLDPALIQQLNRI